MLPPTEVHSVLWMDISLPQMCSEGDHEREAELCLSDPEASWGLSSQRGEVHLITRTALPLSSLFLFISNKILFWKNSLTFYNNSLESPGQSQVCWGLAARKWSQFRPNLRVPCPHFRHAQKLHWGAETHQAPLTHGDLQLWVVLLLCRSYPNLPLASLCCIFQLQARLSLLFTVYCCCLCSIFSTGHVLSHVFPGTHLISH